MSSLALDKAFLVSLWVETLLYGGYAVLFGLCVHILAFGSRKGINAGKTLLVTAIIMFTLSTIHVGVGLAIAINAFIASADKPGGASGYYSQIGLWPSIFKQALYVTNNILADGLVIYRCYIVWGFEWKIIVLPVIMLIATTVSGYLAVFNFSQVKPGQDVFASNIAPWGTTLFGVSLATNITVTSLIAGRIWWISRGSRDYVGRRHTQKYNTVLAIIFESGAIYSASLMTLLILYCIKSNAGYIAYDALSQIMVIVPTLIIVRVGLGITKQTATTSTTRGSTLPHFQHPGGTMPLKVHKVVQIDAEIDTTYMNSGTSGRVITRGGEEDKYNDGDSSF